jgi:transcriptional regulator GlxA family with amidase domain
MVGTLSLTPTRIGAHDGVMPTRRIVIVAFDGVQPLDVTGPHEVFAGANAALAGAARAGVRDRPAYELSVVAPHSTTVRSESGLPLGAAPLPNPGDRIDTLILAGGDGVQQARHDQVLMSWITAAADNSRRVATVCSGTFLAAQAGLLRGRRVTTHWARARQLAREFPDLHVDADPIYVHDGPVWTSAGVTAGIDLSLALVEADHGSEVAQTVARWLVMFLHRPGGQTQYATPVWTPRAERSSVRATQLHIDALPAADHRVALLARNAAMSERNFTRVFTDEVGESPARYVERVRIEAARRELETTDGTLDVVAQSCGFGTAETLRRAFQRRLGVAPDTYRRRFRVA